MFEMDAWAEGFAEGELKKESRSIFCYIML